MIDPITLSLLGGVAYRLLKGAFLDEPSTKPKQISAKFVSITSEKKSEIDALNGNPLAALVALIAKLASADGEVSRKRMSEVRKCFNDLKIQGEDLKRAKKIFSRGKGGSLTFRETLKLFLDFSNRNELASTTAMLMLGRISAADGKPSRKALSKLQIASEMLNCTIAESLPSASATHKRLCKILRRRASALADSHSEGSVATEKRHPMKIERVETFE